MAAFCAVAGTSAAWADPSGDLSSAAVGAVETVVVTGTKATVDVNKDATPLVETPQNIQVISSALLSDQHDIKLDDALRNVAGVMPGGYYSNYDYFRLRGFDDSGYIYLDGLLFDSGVQLNAELYGLEQIEIMKGPSSALYGQGPLGGLVNLVSKRPQDVNALTLEASYGSYGSYEGDFDGNAVLSDSVNGRLVAMFRHSGEFTQHVGGNDRTYIAPSVTWDIDANTQLTVLGSYQHDDGDSSFPLTYIGGVVPGPTSKRYPLDRYTGEPGRSNVTVSNRDAIGYEFSHRLSDVFTIKQNFRYVWNDTDWDHIMYSAYLDTDDRTLYRYPYSAQGAWGNWGVDTRIEAVFNTGEIAHTLIAGVDYYNYLYKWNSQEIDYSDPAAYMPLDLYNPVYGAPFPVYSSFNHVRQIVRDTGYYIQDHAKWGDFTLTLSGRYDTARTGDGWSGVFTSHSDDKFVPRVGLTYALAPQTALYASYSESFLPIAGSTFAGGSLKPETGQQYEAGVKANLWDGRVDVTASVYQLTRQNVSTDDLAHVGYSVQTGEQQSKGFELDAHAQLADGWDAILTYAYVNARVTRDNAVPIGDHPLDVPPTSIGFWTKYEVQDGALKGFGIGGGVYRYASQWGDLPNSFKLPDYTLVNGLLSYDFGPAELQFNVKNIFDERYYLGSYDIAYIQPGAPRNYTLSISWKM
ncbi:MAG: TonB-dependent siderophore receptor [Rhizomicrobium sp.]